MSDVASEEPPLTHDLRATLGRLADGLIPATDVMPSATGVGVERKWIDRALAVRPDLEAPLHEVLTAAREAPDALEELRRLERDDPEGLEVVQRLVAGAYYMAPPVRKRLGYQGQTQRPIRADEADYYLNDELLAPVLAKGRCYRPAPDLGGAK